MSYFLDVKEAFLECNDDNTAKAFESIGLLLEDIEKEGVDYYYQLLKDECIDMCICPECYGGLVITTIGDDITEAWGRIDVNPVSARICEECGGLIDDN